MDWEVCFTSQGLVSSDSFVVVKVNEEFRLLKAKILSNVTRIRSNFTQLVFDNLPAAAHRKKWWPTALHKYSLTTGKPRMLYKYLFLHKSTTRGDISLLLQSSSAGALEQSVSIVSSPAQRRWSRSWLPNLTLTNLDYQSHHEEPWKRKKWCHWKSKRL